MAGNCADSGDFLIHSANVPWPSEDDLLDHIHLDHLALRRCWQLALMWQRMGDGRLTEVTRTAPGSRPDLIAEASWYLVCSQALLDAIRDPAP